MKLENLRLAKLDISRAFRNLTVDSKDGVTLGITLGAALVGLVLDVLHGVALTDDWRKYYCATTDVCCLV